MARDKAQLPRHVRALDFAAARAAEVRRRELLSSAGSMTTVSSDFGSRPNSRAGLLLPRASAPAQQ